MGDEAEPSTTLAGTRLSGETRTTRCNICGGESRRVINGPPALRKCSACGLTALAVFPTASERAGYYQQDYYEEATGARFLRVFEWALAGLKMLRVRSILRRQPGPGSILDVGCGRGDLLDLFQRRGWRALGTQLSRTAARAARDQRGVEIACGELPSLGLEPEQFDVITFFHVLEHLDRPASYLEAARELLRDDGLLVVEVPDCSSLAFRLLPRRNLCLDYPHHLVFFTPRSLQRLLERSGFRLVGAARFTLEYSPYTTLQNLLNLLPGAPNRLYRALMRNPEALRLRREPLTWIHAALAALFVVPAAFLSCLSLILPCGNTVRFYARKAVGA